MTNLSIANVCNLNCPYCFAQAYLAESKNNADRHFITPTAFEKHLDFLDQSDIQEIRLIGGEPTLHPQFPELIRRARRRAKKIIIFSNGLIPARALDALTALAPDECVVLLNMNATKSAGIPTETESKRRRAAMKRLGARVLPGFTIAQPDFHLDFLLPLIEETNCRRSIRLGLAQPILGSGNRYLHPKQYSFAGQKIIRFARRTAAVGVSLEFDCGFVRCMFSDDDLAYLREAKADVGWRCNPILDVDIDGQVFHCFPLSGLVQLALDGSDAAVLRQQFDSFTGPYRRAGIYRECSTCPVKQRAGCSGGCLANIIRRYRHMPLQVEVPREEQFLSANFTNENSPNTSNS